MPFYFFNKFCLLVIKPFETFCGEDGAKLCILIAWNLFFQLHNAQLNRSRIESLAFKNFSDGFNTTAANHIFYVQVHYLFCFNAFRNVLSKLMTQLLSVIRCMFPLS